MIKIDDDEFDNLLDQVETEIEVSDKKEENEISPQDMQFKSMINCPKKHGLNEFKIEKKGSHICDACKKKDFDIGFMFSSCRKCNFDICQV